MRPLKLIMSAFGPYGDEQVLDFTVLEGRNIFLVTGVTGAGKTTVFDAISYALFGEASGSSRENSSLRSHFAKVDTETYVDFTFEVKGETYQIIRSPEQEVKKKRGEGTTIKGMSVELILPKGEKPLSKATDVQARIREIVGVDKEQFRQIVMLPQGEFRKLLEAKSSEREVIFRKIFGTQAFLKIQMQLRDRKNKLSEGLRLDRNSIGIYIQNLKAPQEHQLNQLKLQEDIDTAQVIEQVQLLEKADEQEILVQTENLVQMEQKHSEAKTKLTLAQETNKKVATYLDAKEKLSKHLEQQEAVGEQKEKVMIAQKALEVKVIDESVVSTKAQLKQREVEYQEAQVLESQSQARQLQIAEKVLKAKALEPERQKLRQEITYLTPFCEKLEVYGPKQQELEQMQEQMRTKQLQMTQTEERLKGATNELEKLQQLIVMGVKAEAEKTKQEAILSQKSKARCELLNLHQRNQNYMEKQVEYGLQLEKVKASELCFKESRHLFQEKEDLFRKGQAGILAEGLEEGTPCPVCGAEHHPSKTSKIEGIPTEEELKALGDSKEKLEAIYQQELKCLGELDVSMKDLQNNAIAIHIEALSDLLGPDYSRLGDKEKEQQYIVSCGKTLRSEIQQIEERVKQLEDVIEQGANAQLAQKESETVCEQDKKLLLALGQEVTQLTATQATLAERLRQIEEELPEHLRDKQQLELQIKTLNESLEASLKQLEELLKCESQIQAACAAYAKDKQVKAHEQEKARREYGVATQQLEEMLSRYGFETYAHYEGSYLPKDEIKQLEERCKTYEQTLQTLKALYTKSKEDAQGLDYIAIETLGQVVASYADEENKQRKALTDIRARIEHNQEQLGHIEVTRIKISEIEDEYRIVAELENVAFGEKLNKKRMTFESYVLTAYFDEIIVAANKRLEKMSSGRFELRRKEAFAKGNGKQGLDLEVLDYHTGRARDVKTLSGGEGFKASLSLALGLADVIQCHAGGISIETMFVDEGFGTLDAASLDSAIECLLGLQQGGRLIGIISHVAELKERVEAILEVKTSVRGSQVEFVI
ncbi:MAG: AAA family ATPase [Cellulosilyticaceae bacterium]